MGSVTWPCKQVHEQLLQLIGAGELRIPADIENINQLLNKEHVAGVCTLCPSG